MTAKPTPSGIKKSYMANNHGHFFDRSTMRWFGDTMRSFAVIVIGGTVYLYRKPSATVNVFGVRKTAGRQYFNCWQVGEDGALLTASHDVENLVWDAI